MKRGNRVGEDLEAFTGWSAHSAGMFIQAAQEFAAQRIKDPQDRERFLVHLRAVMAASIQKGEPLPEVRLRDRSAEPEQRPPVRRPERDEPTR